MKKLIILFLLATVLWSCNNNGNSITGSWKYENGDDHSMITFREDGTYSYEQIYKTTKENTDLDSGTFRVLEGDVYEFTSLHRAHNGSQVNVASNDQYLIRFKPDGLLAVLPGRLYIQNSGNKKELTNSTFYSIIAQGEYNNAFNKYVFTGDSVFRFLGYSQTEEIADSLYRPYMFTGLRVNPDYFTTVRTAPDGKEFTEDFSYYFIGDKLFFGKEKEFKEFRKVN